jgi:hypothetical protein
MGFCAKVFGPDYALVLAKAAEVAANATHERKAAAKAGPRLEIKAYGLGRPHKPWVLQSAREPVAPLRVAGSRDVTPL